MGGSRREVLDVEDFHCLTEREVHTVPTFLPFAITRSRSTATFCTSGDDDDDGGVDVVVKPNEDGGSRATAKKSGDGNGSGNGYGNGDNRGVL